MWCQRLMLAYLKRTKKSTCCNNCTDQRNLSSILESSIFSVAYLQPSGTSMMEFAEIAYGLQQLTSFAKKTPSQMFAWVLNAPLLLVLLQDFPDCFLFILFRLRIITGKRHRQIKLQSLQKLRMQAFGLLVHRIKSL